MGRQEELKQLEELRQQIETVCHCSDSCGSLKTQIEVIQDLRNNPERFVFKGKPENTEETLRDKFKSENENRILYGKKPEIIIFTVYILLLIALAVIFALDFYTYSGILVSADFIRKGDASWDMDPMTAKILCTVVYAIVTFFAAIIPFKFSRSLREWR